MKILGPQLLPKTILMMHVRVPPQEMEKSLICFVHPLAPSLFAGSVFFLLMLMALLPFLISFFC